MGKHKGFTLIEVMLFLAITAALFAGIAMAVNNVMLTQQYNDTTQNFFEFMRSIYSQVSNPESPAKGNSNQAIYGKLVVFGQTKDLDGIKEVMNGNAVFVYDVVGDVLTADDPITGSMQDLLNKLNAQVVMNCVKNNKIVYGKLNPSNCNSSTSGTNYAYFALAEKYELRWGAAIEESTSRTLFKGAFLIARHPKSGVINTLYSTNNGLFRINEDKYDKVCNNKKQGTCFIPGDGSNRKVIWSQFNTKEVIMCINPNGLGGNGSMRRQAIRIDENARNASGIQMVDLDASGGNACK